MKKLPVELRTFQGVTICTLVIAEEHPAIVVLQNSPQEHRAFYKVSSTDRGRTGIYQECDTKTIIN